MDILKKKIGFVSLGCDKNRVDLEKMISNIHSAGFEITGDAKSANVVIINTCSFIKTAREESIEAILTAGKCKENKQLEHIIVTGCLNEMQYSDLESSLPEVDAFVNIKDNDKIVDKIYALYGEKPRVECVYSTVARELTTPHHYAYLKIADGCDNFCSYCKIPYIRGRYRSESLDNLMIEAKNLVDSGVKEIILVAQDVTKYGSDFKDGTTLVTLIRRLSELQGLHWIRLLYCYPESITDDLISEIRDNPKVCKYLDIPLQHVDSDILKSMNRKNNYDKIVNLITKLRHEIPDIALRTTFIVGLPGEKKEHFNRLLQFVKEFKLNYVGFFKYSREEGTRAYDFAGQVSEKTKQSRLDAISEVQYANVLETNANEVGKEYEVVVDRIEDDYAVCRSQYQNPESDNVIYVNNLNMHIGEFYKVKIVAYEGYDLEGEKL